MKVVIEVGDLVSYFFVSVVVGVELWCNYCNVVGVDGYVVVMVRFRELF